MEDINKQVGFRIRGLREKKGMTQEGLADRCGLHRSDMGEIERGELNVTLKTLQKVGVALELSLIELVRGVGQVERRVVRA